MKVWRFDCSVELKGKLTGTDGRTFEFPGYSRSVLTLRLKRNRNVNRKIHIRYQIRKPASLFDIQMLGNGKYANRNEHQNQQNQRFWHKNRKTITKNIAKTEKLKIPTSLWCILFTILFKWFLNSWKTCTVRFKSSVTKTRPY